MGKALESPESKRNAFGYSDSVSDGILVADRREKPPGGRQTAVEVPTGERRLQMLFENLVSGVIIFGAINDGDDFVVNEINPAAERIEGVRREEVIGRGVLDVFPGFLDLGLFHGLKHCWISGNTGHYPAAVYSDQGNARWRKSDIFQLPSGEVVCVYNDITEHKLAEEKTGQALKEKELLLQEVHHRVKNNIQILYSLLRLQSAHTEDPAVREQLLSTLSRVRAMSLIQERLHSSNNFSRIDFPGYVQNMIVHLQNFHHVDPRTIEINVDMEECLMDLSQAVPLGLIMNELISNAFRHAFPGGRSGTLTIFFRTLENGSGRLAVKDDGVGVPKEVDFDSPQSFGLQIVKTLVDQLNGELRVCRIGGTDVAITFFKSDPKQIIDEIAFY